MLTDPYSLQEPWHTLAAAATTVSAAQLLGIALVAAINGLRKDGARRRAWFVLSALFCFLAVDELLEVHEYLTIRAVESFGTSKSLTELLVLSLYLAFGGWALFGPIRAEILGSPFSVAALLFGAVLLGVWIIGSIAPEGMLRFPEKALKVTAFTFILMAFVRQAVKA